MNHSILVAHTLASFSDEVLEDKFVDTTLGLEDQQVLSLRDHITECSENWELANFCTNSPIRPPQSLNDMLGYIKQNLKPSISRNAPQPFYYINSTYMVNAYIGCKIRMSGKPGTIKEDRGNYIGVAFDDSPDIVVNCHPTWEIEYLDK